MVQPFPTHNISFSQRIPQRFSSFPYKSSLLAQSVTWGLQARTPPACTATMAPVLGTSKRAWKYLFPPSACLALDISLEGSYIKNEMHLVQACQVLLQSILVFLQNLPPGSQDIFSLLLHVTETPFVLHTPSTGLTEPFTALRFSKNGQWALFLPACSLPCKVRSRSAP